MTNRMRSGQFAQLCRTTKDTLRHYEELGLLTPASVAANGYKEYLPAQAIDFMLIAALRDAGCPLSAIGSIQRGSKERLRGVMSDCLASLDGQIAELERKRALLAGSLARMDELETWREADGKLHDGAWRIAELPAAWHLETRIPLAKGLEAAFDAISRHAASCESQGLGLVAQAQQASYRIGSRAFASGDYGADFHLCTPLTSPLEPEDEGKRTKGDRSPLASGNHLRAAGTDEPTDPSDMHLRPAGTYLQQLTALPLEAAYGEGPFTDNAVFASYDALKRIAAAEGLDLAGDAYDAELSLGTLDGTDLLWKQTSVRIAAGPEGHGGAAEMPARP